MRQQARKLIGFAAIAVLIVAALVFRPDLAIRSATAYTSEIVCSAIYISDLDPDRFFADQTRVLPGMNLIGWGIRYNVDRQRHEVTARFAGLFENRAVYRSGLGCVVVHGVEPPDAPVTQAIEIVSLQPKIAGPTVVEPTNPRLRAALDQAFANPGWVKAVVVVRDGRVIAERYAPGYGVNNPILGSSLTKSMTNALIGILVRQGRLSASQPAPVASWGGPDDPRRAITIDELLRMTSGLAVDETDTGFDPWTRALTLERDIAGTVERAGLESAPGSRWNYTSANTMILSRIIRDLVGGHAEDVLRFEHQELFDPLGMRTAKVEFDATETPMGWGYGFASARDWARLGMLYLNDGVVSGRRILPEGWVSYSASRTGTSPYAAGFWVGSKEWRDRWRVPSDLFFGTGVLGQKLAVIPSQQLVIVRLAITPVANGDQEGFGRLISGVVAALR